VVERFHRSLKYERLYQREITNATELAEEVESFLRTFSEVRSHESLGQRIPPQTQCENQDLLETRSAQGFDSDIWRSAP
jgi:hypothetical protein